MADLTALHEWLRADDEVKRAMIGPGASTRELGAVNALRAAAGIELPIVGMADGLGEVLREVAAGPLGRADHAAIGCAQRDLTALSASWTEQPAGITTAAQAWEAASAHAADAIRSIAWQDLCSGRDLLAAMPYPVDELASLAANGLGSMVLAAMPPLPPYWPGGPIGDLLTFADERAPTKERYVAACRLAVDPFSFRRVFAAERRPAVGAAIGARRGDRSWRHAWADLLVPCLFAECTDISEELSIRELFQEMRRRLRRAIEVELFDCTLDSRASKDLHLADDPELPDPVDLLEMAEARFDALFTLRRALQSLAVEEARLLVNYHAEDADRHELARVLGVKPPALRKRVERIKGKLNIEVPL